MKLSSLTAIWLVLIVTPICAHGSSTKVDDIDPFLRGVARITHRPYSKIRQAAEEEINALPLLAQMDATGFVHYLQNSPTFLRNTGIHTLKKIRALHRRVSELCDGFLE